MLQVKKSGLGVRDLAIEIERRAKVKKDVVVSTKDLAMTSDGSLGVGGQFVVPVNKTCHDQIASHVDIPAKYYEKMRSEAPDLLANNVNRWFAKYPAPRMVRMLDDRARGFLSDRFRPLENEDLAEAVLPPIRDLGLDIMSCQITETRMYIKAVDPKVTRELQARNAQFGDGSHTIIRCLAPAVTIANSEIGYSSLSVLGGVYDGFCSNLATFGERSVRKYHIGGRHEIGEETYALLSDETRRKTDAALWAQIGDVVRAAFDRARFDELCDKIEKTTTQKIQGDVVKVVNLAAKKFAMTEGEGSSILKHLIEGGDTTRFGLYNAITRTAQDLEDYDRTTAFERAGAQVIELKPGEWNQLAAAA